MTEVNTRFPVSLTKEEVKAIIRGLHEIFLEEELKTGLIERLRLRLAQREQELANLKELMEGPDMQVGIQVFSLDILLTSKLFTFSQNCSIMYM